MRDAFGLAWLDELVTDLRYATRLLRKSLGFTFIAVASLALAIGAKTTIFSLANEMLYRRLGVPNPQQLRILVLHGRTPSVFHSYLGSTSEENGVNTLNVFPYPIYHQLQAGNRSLGPIAGFVDLDRVNLTAGGQAQSVEGELISGNLYSVLDVKPQLGRPILRID